MDTSRIEHLFLKENYLLGLNFPVAGIMPLRVLAKEFVYYKYQAVSITNEGARGTTGTVAADAIVDSARLSLSTFNIDNVLRVLDCNKIYQVFIGIKPSAIRHYTYYPLERSTGGLDVKPIFSKSPYGYIDGYESPYDSPSEKTEIWIPKGVDVGFSWHNPLNSEEQIDLNILIVKYLTKVVRDADLVEGIIKGKVPARIATLGGLEQVSYNSRSVFNADLIPFDSERGKIESSLEMK